jgi:indolepyruvate ferredoxin oxidoreductase
MSTTDGATVSLDDKYTVEKGRVFLSGTQALVRLLLALRQRDRAAGMNTGVFVSGYRGSPLGGFDYALWRARAFLEAENIHFVPGVNEDLAATAVWGSQQVNLKPGSQVEGVAGVWYGKGPGADRSLDVFKHANAAGVDPKGGVLAILGDDHGCESSTLAHQSEEVMIAARIPVLFPSSLAEYIDFGLKGIALSRYSGCWVGFKAVSETVDGSATIDVDPLGLDIRIPQDFVPPAGGLGIRWPDPALEVEKRLHGPKMQAIAAFARVNPFDKAIWHPSRAKVGIVATGKAYVDLRQALDLLGIDESRAAALGLALYKVGLIWPLEIKGAVDFSTGLDELIFVEEKLGIVEDQFRQALYELPHRPQIVGKRDQAGDVLFPSAGVLDPIQIALKIGERLLRRGADSGVSEAVAALKLRRDVPVAPTTLVRKPYFCSGCPHNTSTQVPEGSRALGGIGCHGLVLQMPERRTEFRTHMGGEGTTWIGQSPFNGRQHIFQNLGDGTYYHSGLLAIRAAAAAGINITYKILFNDAVAMTGGQPHDGPLTVPAITRQVAAEGARKIHVITDQVDKYPTDAGFAPGVVIYHRDRLDQSQRELRETPGLTVLVYDQTCAAEKRRRRKRGTYPDPPKRVFINERVCEGCGDCSSKSNCVAVKPVETDFGRKRQIDQSDCNKDFSCIEGFCPSFVTVLNGVVRRPSKAHPVPGVPRIDEAGPAPILPDLDRPWQILITGIGGTGVITLGSLIGMAAHVEGLSATVLDYTGLAQKNGAVMSHIRIARSSDELHAVRIADGQSDALIACDMIVAVGPSALSRLSPSTRAVINDTIQPTSDFIRDGDIDFDNPATRDILATLMGGNANFINATELALASTGDSVATNAFMLGYAWQKGLIPLKQSSIERAIELNAVSVDSNKQTFRLGRLVAQGGPVVRSSAPSPILGGTAVPTGVEAIVAQRKSDLKSYQSATYASLYERVVDRAVQAEARLEQTRGFAESVARNLYKLMAYKDEYEVARLYSDGEFLRRISRQFESGYKLQFHLAPPLISRRDPTTGELIKSTYGSWMLPFFKTLAKAKFLRGTWADPFGHTAERKTERKLIQDYIKLVDEIGEQLTDANCEQAIEIMNWPQAVRGYGHVKERNRVQASDRLKRLLREFASGGARSEPKKGAAPLRAAS